MPRKPESAADPFTYDGLVLADAAGKHHTSSSADRRPKAPIDFFTW